MAETTYLMPSTSFDQLLCGDRIPQHNQYPDQRDRMSSNPFSNIRRKLSRADRGSQSATSGGSSETKRDQSTMLSPNRAPTAGSYASAPTRRPQNNSNPFTDGAAPPPPAYSAAPPPSSSAWAPAASQRGDDAYSFLSTFDTIFLIDDSGSMAGARWEETQQALQTITPICTLHDTNGIDIYFLNAADRPAHHNVTTTERVEEIFEAVRPRGGTPTGQALHKILKRYLEDYKVAGKNTKPKPINIIVITDGDPSDDDASPLIQAAKKLEKLDAPAWQIGIQFFQVGNDPEATRHLQELDDDLANISGDADLRDIVDTVPFMNGQHGKLTGDGILKVVLGAVNRRLDRKKTAGLHG